MPKLQALLVQYPGGPKSEALGFLYSKKVKGYLLGGSWLAIRGVISRVSIVIFHMRRFLTPFITTHEPSSTPLLAPVAAAFELELSMSGTEGTT